jgi:adenosylhomocysteine nucleosidase
VVDRLLQHDTGPDEPGWIHLEPSYLDSMETASRTALAGSPHAVSRGGLITGDRPVLDARERNALARRFDALAVDMEAGAAAAVSLANGIPFAAIKAITDSADGSGKKDFKKHVHQGAAHAQKAVACLLER